MITAADQRLRQLRDACSRRRRHDHRLRPDRRPRLCRPAREADRRSADGGAFRRPRIVGAHQPNSRRAPADGWSRCAWSPKASTCRGCRSVSTPPARRRRCSSRRPSAGSCGRGGRAKPQASSCRRCPTCCSWPVSWRPSATTCWASRTANPRAIRSTTIPPPRRRPRRAKQTRLHLLGRRRRTGSGHLRRLLVRHRHPGRKRRGGRLPRHPRPARRRTDARPAAPPPGRAAAEARRSTGSAGAPIDHPRPAARPASRTQLAGVDRPPPHRQATRMDPQRTCAVAAAGRRSPRRPAISSRHASLPCGSSTPSRP